MWKLTGIILFISMLLASCATIVTGDKQQLTFDSSPKGAIVSINGRQIGKTPLIIEVDRDNQYTVTFEKEGYKTFSAAMETQTDGWFWGNILFGGLLGSTTDSQTGAMYEYIQNEYMVTLESSKTGSLNSDIELSKREMVRRFMFINYGHLRKDLASSQGEYLESTLERLGVSAENRDDMIIDLKSRMFSSEYPSQFIEMTLDKYV